MADSNPSALPTRDEFINNGLQDCTSASQIPPGLDCGICLEELNLKKLVVKIVPCTHCYFHKDCIMAWFQSAHEQCTTCPKDRKVLFREPAPVQRQPRPHDVDLLIQFRIFNAAILIARINLHFLAANTYEQISSAWIASTEQGDVAELELDIIALRSPRPQASVWALQRAQQRAAQFEHQLVRVRNRYLGAVREVMQGRVEELLVIATELANDTSRDYQGQVLQVQLNTFLEDLNSDPGMQNGADLSRLPRYTDRFFRLKEQVTDQQEARRFDLENDSE